MLDWSKPPVPYRRHSLYRTNPKGRPFIGTCLFCSADGLTPNDMDEPCTVDNPTTQEKVDRR